MGISTPPFDPRSGKHLSEKKCRQVETLRAGLRFHQLPLAAQKTAGQEQDPPGHSRVHPVPRGIHTVRSTTNIHQRTLLQHSKIQPPAARFLRGAARVGFGSRAVTPGFVGCPSGEQAQSLTGAQKGQQFKPDAWDCHEGVPSVADGAIRLHRAFD
jgi:hypothetical protein